MTHPGEAWRGIWNGKGAAAGRIEGEPDEVLRALLALDGYDSATGTSSLDDFRALMDYLCDALGLETGHTLYEVGCGAGAVLRTLESRCHVVGGLDYAEALVRVARSVLPRAAIDHVEADALAADPRCDFVVSVGAFLYFADAAYALRVLGRMADKARRGLAVIDVNDEAQRELALRLRAEARGDRPGNPPPQLFLPRGLFVRFAAEHGLALRVDECTMTRSINSRYRYNIFMHRAGCAPAGRQGSEVVR